jgi:hypothetical protein
VPFIGAPPTDVPLIGVPPIGVPLIGVPSIGVSLIGVSLRRASHRRACYGRLISIVAITGIIVERVKRTCEIRRLKEFIEPSLTYPLNYLGSI